MKDRWNSKNRKNILLPIGFTNSEVQLSFLLFPQGKRQFAKKKVACNGVLLSKKIDFCHKLYTAHTYFFSAKDLLLQCFNFWGIPNYNKVIENDWVHTFPKGFVLPICLSVSWRCRKYLEKFSSNVGHGLSESL